MSNTKRIVDEPAFPRKVLRPSGNWSMEGGLTKRELIAAMTVAGAISNSFGSPDYIASHAV